MKWVTELVFAIIVLSSIGSQSNAASETQCVDYGDLLNPMTKAYVTRTVRSVFDHWNKKLPKHPQRVIVGFTIVRDGSLSGLRVLDASGDNEANESAIKAVRAAAPFATFKGRALPLTLTIKFTNDFAHGRWDDCVSVCGQLHEKKHAKTESCNIPNSATQARKQVSDFLSGKRKCLPGYDPAMLE